jgi:hypothetical protein
LQSKWVGKELRHALEVQKQRGKDDYPVVPLSLDGTKLGVLEEFFGEEPLYVPLSSAAGGVEAALDPILVALGKRKRADVAATPQPEAEPLEELVLVLDDLKIVQVQDGVRRASGAGAPRVRACDAGPARGRERADLAVRRAARAARGRRPALVPREVRDLAERGVPRSRAQGGGQPRCVGPPAS